MMMNTSSDSKNIQQQGSAGASCGRSTDTPTTKRSSNSKRNSDGNYVASSRRSRASKDKVNSVGDYIRSVLHQLSNSSAPPALLQASASSTHGDGCAEAGSIHQVPTMPTVPSLMSLRSTRASKSTASSSDNPSEQQVWLMIVERMREEIIRARDVHRADLHQSKRSKRKRDAFVPSPGNVCADQPKVAEEVKQYCSICVATPNPATAVTVCGHFLCWACLCKWHHRDATSSLTASKKECPCCKKILTKSQVTFIGEKLDDSSGRDASGKESTTLPLATDQRDKLLQAAALPVLSSRFQYSMHDMLDYEGIMANAKPLVASNYDETDTTAVINSSKLHVYNYYSPSLDTYSSVDHSSMGGYIQDEVCSSIGYTQYQSFAGADTMSSHIRQQDTPASRHVLNEQDSKAIRSQLQVSGDQGVALGLARGAAMVVNDEADCDYECPLDALNMGTNYSQLTIAMQNAGIINDFSWTSLLDSIYSDCSLAGQSFSQYDETLSLLNAYNETLHHMNNLNPVGNTYTSYMEAYPEFAGNGECSVTVEQFLEKILEIDVNDGSFTEAEMQELRQLQETLKLQLASSQPLDSQCSAWLSTLLASISVSTDTHVTTGLHYSAQLYEELPSCRILQNTAGQQSCLDQQEHLDEKTINSVMSSSHDVQEPLGATQYLSTESTTSTAAASPLSSSANHHNIIPSTATLGIGDEVLSDWRCVFDDTTWDWSITDGLSPL